MNLSKIESEKKKDSVVPLFPNSQHFGPVKDISSSLGRGVIASIGADNYLRIWNPDKGWICELAYEFQEPPLSVAIHPIGLQVAIGFGDKLKVAYLSSEGLMVALENVSKECKSVKYNRSGSYLAAGSEMTITILCGYTLS
mmetsp:Transcript_8880/g.1274  ORF Transcript_8880/g.1274 Transcript_8880/m.1274 type:complete len:141 (-) Transcript_8880:1515-1937(-)